MSDSHGLFQLRQALAAARSQASSLADDISAATRKLQQAEISLANAKAIAAAESEEKSATGRRNDVEFATLLEKAEVDVEGLELKLALIRLDLFKTTVSALQSEIKTYEVEARFA